MTPGIDFLLGTSVVGAAPRESWSARRARSFLFAGFIVEVVARLFCIAADHFPRVFWDEPSYLAYAEYFARIRTFDLTGAPAVHWGYGLFLSPLFMLHVPFPATYRLVLVANCFLLASVLPLLYAIGRQAFGLRRELAFGLALATSCYPPLILFATFSMTENLYVPLFLVTILMLVNALQKTTFVRLAAFSALTAALYAVHVWGFTVMLVGAIVLLSLGALRLARWDFVGGSLAVQVVLGMGVANVTASMQRDMHTTVVPGAASLLLSGLSPGLLRLVFKTIVSEFFAIDLATACMFALALAFGIVILVLGLRKDTSALARPDSGASVFIVLCNLAIVVASPIALTAMGPAGNVPETYLDCRYFDAEVAPAIFLALLVLFRRKAWGARLVDGCFLASMVALFLSWFASRGVVYMLHWEGRGDFVFGLALLGMLRLFGLYSVGLLTGIVLGAAVLVFLGYRKWPAAGVAALAALYLASATAAAVREYVPDFRSLEARIGSPNAGRLVTALGTLPPGTMIPDELKEGTYAFFGFYQLSLPNLTIAYFNPDLAPPTGTYALVRASWPGAQYGYENVGCETFTDTCLWTNSPSAARTLAALVKSSDPWSGGIRFSAISGLDFGSLDQPWATTRGVLASEADDSGLTWRWTDGRGEYLLDGILGGRPSELAVSLYLAVPENVRIVAGAVRLFSGSLPAGRFERTFAVDRVDFARPETLHIFSVPVAASPPAPYGALGVQVRGLRLR